jgi:myo-inositol 2-dehydrogenase/D-chiro-inositol 1-dehydrogenase
VGNWILEEPIHFFDLARWYFLGAGKPVSVNAAANGRRPDHPELHDNFSAIVQFSHGGHATITQTLCGWEHHQTAKITGSDGAIWASWSGAMDRTFEPTFSLKVRRGESVEQIAIAKPSGEVYELVDQVAGVIAAVRDGSAVPCTGEDGLWSAAMCLKAAESLQTGGPVSLKEL